MFQSSVLPEEIESLPLVSFDGPITVIDHPGPELEYALKYLRKQKMIGFDTESRPTFAPSQPHYGVSLLQLSGSGEAFLFRIKLMGMDERLCDILADERIIKVGAAVKDDVRGLQRYRQFDAKNFIDLQQIVWEYGIRDKSVKKMSAIILGARISKTQQLSNWEADELSEAQLKYAATDAWICREMLKKLRRSAKNPLADEACHAKVNASSPVSFPSGTGESRRKKACGGGSAGQSAQGDGTRADGKRGRRRRRRYSRHHRHGRKGNVKNNTEER